MPLSPDMPFSSDAPRAAFVDISPERARRWLAKNRRNRPLREGQVQRYAQLMQEGAWMSSPDAIAFDKQGRLINGQHRLRAVLESGVTVENALVAWGLPEGAFKIADMGAKRTAADVLHIEGFKHPQELGAVMKLVVLWAEGRLQQCNEYEVVEKYKILEAAEACVPRVYASIERVGAHKEALRGSLPRSLVSFVHFLYRPTYGEKAGSFVDQILTGKGIVDWVAADGGATPKPEASQRQLERGTVYDSPAYLLRRKITSRRTSAGREKWLAWTIKCANWHCNREPHSKIRYRTGDRFPEPAVEGIPELGRGPGPSDNRA